MCEFNLKNKWADMFLSGEKLLQGFCDGCNPHSVHVMHVLHVIHIK